MSALGLLLNLALLTAPAQVPAVDTISSFPTSWKLFSAQPIEENYRGTKVVKIDGATSKESTPTLSVVTSKPPTDKVLKLKLWMKGEEEGQWVRIQTFARRGTKTAESRIIPEEGYVTTEYARLSPGWKLYSKTVLLSRSCDSFEVRITNRWKQSLYVSSPSLEVGANEMCDLDGPGIIRCDFQVHVMPDPKGKGPGKITFPVPIVYRDQAPLAFKLTSKPANLIKSYKLIKRPDGLNWLCEAELSLKKGTIHWEALVYVRPRNIALLPRTDKPEVKPMIAQWLKRSECVQTEAPEIVAQAEKLGKDDPDIETYARRVTEFSSQNLGNGTPLTTLDAKAAMACGGSCTSRANLAAALLRLRGIPARTVAHLPTWNYGNLLFTHWLVEYWHPKVGWTWLETALGEFEPQPYTLAILAISSIADENASWDPLDARWVMPGAPKWAFPALSASLTGDNGKNNQTNWGRAEKRIVGSKAELDSLYVKAQSLYEKLVSSRKYSDPRYFKSIEKAISSGRAVKLQEAIGN